jgi:hypothetical protein
MAKSALLITMARDMISKMNDMGSMVNFKLCGYFITFLKKNPENTGILIIPKIAEIGDLVCVRVDECD